ncbi:MAG: hypothetical protein R3286_00935 [Gammaproteobacteria bacterium]|nr:hypothetical protein [Gammaproteobacteria bacterium]
MRFALHSLVVAALGLGGCGLLEQHVSSPGTASRSWVQSGNVAAPRAVDEGRDALQPYVVLVDVLRRTDAEGRHPIFQHAFRAYQQNPSSSTRLRLALVLTETQRSAAELSVARDLYVDVLRDPGPMPPLVRMYAEARLHEVDQRLALHEEIAALKREVAAARAAASTHQRDAAATERDLRRVEAALAEANAKLQAVMNIEKDIGPSGKGTFP